MKRETRTLAPSEVRVTAEDDGTHRFEAVVMNYGVVDDYDTIFDAGCFTESLAERLPRITWAHNWSDPIGRYVDYVDTDESLTLIGELDDFDAVPRARQAFAQLQSGTIDQFSVGFARDKIAEDDDGRVHFTKARLDETALVLAGAVPNTHLVGVRTRAGGLTVVREVPEETLVALAKKVAAGEITQEEAKAALDLVADTPAPEPKVEPTPTPVDEPHVESDADAVADSLTVG